MQIIARDVPLTITQALLELTCQSKVFNFLDFKYLKLCKCLLVVYQHHVNARNKHFRLDGPDDLYTLVRPVDGIPELVR